MYDKERMKSIADKICAKRAEDETKQVQRDDLSRHPW